MRTITELAREPKLIRVEIDTPEIQEEFGDTVVFWMRDFVDITTYFDFYRNQTENGEDLQLIIRRLVLDEQGQQAIRDNQQLPATLALAVITKLNEHLGKSETKSSMNNPGNQ